MRDFSILGTIHFPLILTHCLSLLLKCSPCLRKLLTGVTGCRVYSTCDHRICMSKVQYLQGQGVHLLNFQKALPLWSFDSLEGSLSLPSTSEFEVISAGRTLRVVGKSKFYISHLVGNNNALFTVFQFNISLSLLKFWSLFDMVLKCL